MKTNTLEPYLKEHPFFKGLAQEHIDFLVGCSKNVKFNEGELIFRQDEAADYFLLVRHGQVSVEVPALFGPPISIQTVKDGEVLGWSWLFPPFKWHFDARAMETTRAIALDGKCLREKKESDSKLGYELMKRFSAVMLERLQSTRMQILDMYG